MIFHAVTDPGWVYQSRTSFHMEQKVRFRGVVYFSRWAIWEGHCTARTNELHSGSSISFLNRNLTISPPPHPKKGTRAGDDQDDVEEAKTEQLDGGLLGTFEGECCYYGGYLLYSTAHKSGLASKLSQIFFLYTMSTIDRWWREISKLARSNCCKRRKLTCLETT